MLGAIRRQVNVRRGWGGMGGDGRQSDPKLPPRQTKPQRSVTRRTSPDTKHNERPSSLFLPLKTL